MFRRKHIIITPRIFLFLIIIIGQHIDYTAQAQASLSSNPEDAVFVYTDIANFWLAFDDIESRENPFIGYLENGSAGLKDFIPNRIESPEKLQKVVKRRHPDYESIRTASNRVESYEGQIRLAYQEFSKVYKEATFPPTYYVIGAFNTGGTAAESGLIIGVERQDNIENIPYVVAHEIIHYNQDYPSVKSDLLSQSIIEGSADFIGELISGRHPNEATFLYGNENEQALCIEFVKIMHNYSYQGWLYGSKGKKKDRPNDLGYWIGYNICKSYYAKLDNKQKAIADILTIKDFDKFLAKSGYLKEYLE